MKHLTEFAPANERIKSVLSTLEGSLVSFSEVTKIPITFYSPIGEIIWEYNEAIKICRTNASYCDPDSHCRHTLHSAMNIAFGLGEVYIFVCDTGLINLSYALTADDRIIGYFIAGPIAMGTSRERSLKHFYDKVINETVDFPSLMNMTDKIRIFTPKEITHLMTLYELSFNVPGSGSLNVQNRQKSREQTMVVSKIIEMKKSNISVDYPVASENSLLVNISSGNRDLALRDLSKYVEDLMVFENGDISLIRLRLLSVFSQLSKNTVASYEYENLIALETLTNAATLKELMESATAFVDSATSSISSERYSGNSDVVAKALAYIHSHYMHKITLATIASEIHVNESYFSTLFKKETHTSFTSYLRDLRMENAAKKLKTSPMNITEVSLSCGFDHPSYFAKAFKEKYGLTPRQYRIKKD